ncbi:hypothetical protein B0H14DRAFT_2631068 [Mycena olivaceomarginata]|nr:hypothetical protein B0H14DRAFT_2631068 [Mycena olivaceomarginata]
MRERVLEIALVRDSTEEGAIDPNPEARLDLLGKLPPDHLRYSHAEAIYTTYADPEHVQELREQRIPDEHKRDADAKAANKGKKPDGPLPHIKMGNMVFENAILFLRDALLTREFTDAVEAGDSVRVVNIMRRARFAVGRLGPSKGLGWSLNLNGFPR